jgi:Kae1-associated kinase Bud32
MNFKKLKIVSKGAEAEILQINENTLIKKRISKKYRLKEIDDKILSLRNKREFKVLKKLHDNNINVPKPFEYNEEELYFSFEFLNGKNLKESLNEKYNEELIYKALNEIIKIHNLNIVHNDLTSLNMINYKNKIYIIDFGLAKFTNSIEEKAVDLNLFFTCIKNEHPNYYNLKNELENKYFSKTIEGDKIIQRLHQIEKRGRNKQKTNN